MPKKKDAKYSSINNSLMVKNEFKRHNSNTPSLDENTCNMSNRTSSSSGVNETTTDDHDHDHDHEEIESQLHLKKSNSLSTNLANSLLCNLLPSNGSDSNISDQILTKLLILEEEILKEEKEIKRKKMLIKSLKNDFKKYVTYCNKMSNKRVKIKKGNGADTPVSDKKILLSTEMYLFLNIPKKEPVYRHNIMLQINEYIEVNKLRDTTNLVRILPDIALANLLNEHIAKFNEKNPLTYFNLKKYIKQHFLPYKNNGTELNNNLTSSAICETDE